ncbi:MAPEG family protein, partial [Raoultella ornithinolytica]|uniref:MAPEG family protein n=1 Tax=Raoultella ornithinolytica TaxID=54291 RepID=UPI001953FA42
LIGVAMVRRKASGSGETGSPDIALGEFELPVLFYALIALALPLRHADLFIVLMSWVFVVTRFAHAGLFVSSNHL